MNDPRLSLFPKGVAALRETIAVELQKIDEQNILKRFAARDVTLWSNDPHAQEEIAHRLGWLDAAESQKELAREAKQLRHDLIKEGYTHAVVLGMGGSSLAPEVYSAFAQNFPMEDSHGLKVSILDSTSPEQILLVTGMLPLKKTLFIVSSKSGTTVEVNTLLAYFWGLYQGKLEAQVGKHFVAISDPDTPLVEKARKKDFRQVFEADPHVGGRYSALIAFGLVPAVLAGYNGEALLESAGRLALTSSEQGFSCDIVGVQLGIILAAAYHASRDKLTLLTDPATSAFGSWVEQLVAESSGKNGKGIIPVDLEKPMRPEEYSQDRLFVYLRSEGALDGFTQGLINAGHPVFVTPIHTANDLASGFFIWEYATALTCALLGVNAFDQPNVQESKDISWKVLKKLQNNEPLEIGQPVAIQDGISVYGSANEGQKESVSAYLKQFLASAVDGDYLAINAFVARSHTNQEKLQDWRAQLTAMTGLCATLGFGPRFLHSTGQLHKGGKNNGFFIVISQDEGAKLEIPGEDLTFDDLILAQALGDTQALHGHFRRVMRLHFAAGVFNQTDLKKVFGD